MARLRFVLAGALLGLTWAASLRGYMMQIAGPDSTFTFSGTFGIILPSGTLTGALLGWAAWQYQAGRQYRLLIAAPLLLGVLPVAATGEPDLAPAILALAGMIGGYALSGRGPRWARLVAGILTAGAAVAPFCAPGPFPDLSATTPHGAWAATLGSSLFLAFTLACSIPMRAVRQAGPSRSAAAADLGGQLDRPLLLGRLTAGRADREDEAAAAEPDPADPDRSVGVGKDNHVTHVNVVGWNQVLHIRDDTAVPADPGPEMNVRCLIGQRRPRPAPIRPARLRPGRPGVARVSPWRSWT